MRTIIQTTIHTWPIYDDDDDDDDDDKHILQSWAVGALSSDQIINTREFIDQWLCIINLLKGPIGWQLPGVAARVSTRVSSSRPRPARPPVVHVDAANQS
jgi:hypothetical protein